MTGFEKIGVLGGGAWGTALAMAAIRAERDVCLWAREAETVKAINETRENSVYLPGIPLADSLKANHDLESLRDRDAILLVCPAQHMGRMVADLTPCLAPSAALIICAKGIDAQSGHLMSDVIAPIAPGHPLAVLSGPTFAHEVARGLPCALTLACQDDGLRKSLIDSLASPEFRLYGSPDIIGAQVGGAVKNVLAIACGMVAGLTLGENARAAVITRGLSEMVRFGTALGAQKETLMGLSGLGDLLLTCSSTQSRNMSLGLALGQGQSLDEILSARNSVAEGFHSVKILTKLARNHGLDMPISFAVENILGGRGSVAALMQDLMNRPLTDEN